MIISAYPCLNYNCGCCNGYVTTHCLPYRPLPLWPPQSVYNPYDAVVPSRQPEYGTESSITERFHEENGKRNSGLIDWNDSSEYTNGETSSLIDVRSNI